ncbi:MAG TPA: hypothetical protein VGL14_06930 [Methylomirabilota bacterium]|jgi:hypothetical protein
MGYDTPHVFRMAIGVAVRVDGDRATVAYGVDHPGFGVLTREYASARGMGDERLRDEAMTIAPATI